MHCIRLSALLSIFFMHVVAIIGVPTLGNLPLDTSTLPIGSTSGVPNLLSPAPNSSPSTSSQSTNGKLPVNKNLAFPLSMPRIPGGTESLGGLSGLTRGVGLGGANDAGGLVRRQVLMRSNEESLT
ncbi:MAG: hypothetical protein CYPHOPRED_005006 [Cyphobasidiales sp. Tagirdzhanova-0007]|nr:MAG: hypothetical protein CYPHOPRED_005006 [Cyphobasidiales sp. Tagirdzhanova-0007]